jgi:hypothetical protein
MTNSIKNQLEKVSTRTTEHLLQFFITKKQYKVLQVVARHWSEKGNKLSVSELVRRCINLSLSHIDDRVLLNKIKGIMNPEGSDDI